MRQIKIQLQEPINVPLLHDELKQKYLDFQGLVLRGTELTVLLDGPTTQAEINAAVARHDHTQENREEIALRLREEALEVLETIIATETDPILVLEARITRIEDFLQVGLE